MQAIAFFKGLKDDNLHKTYVHIVGAAWESTNEQKRCVCSMCALDVKG